MVEDRSGGIIPTDDVVIYEKWTKKLTPGSLGDVIVLWIYTRLILDIVVCCLQVYKDWNAYQIPDTFRGVSQERFERSKAYRLDKLYAKICGYVYILTVIHYIYLGWGPLYRLWYFSGKILNSLGFWPQNWDPEYGWTIIFIVIGTLFFNAFDLPIHVVNVFVVEQRHGFNHQSLSFFVKDQFKINVFELMVEVPTGILVVAIVKMTPHFHLLLWAISMMVLAFFVTVYPRYIAPMFDTYVPLPEGTLRTSLMQLSERCEYPLEDILILQQSKRTAHVINSFEGSHRIILSDNLLRTYLNQHRNESILVHSREESRMALERDEGGGLGCTEEEIVALIAHEMGHWKANHRLWNVGLAFANLFLFFATFSVYYNSSEMYEVFQFPKKYKKPIIPGLFIVFNHILDTVHFMSDILLRKVARSSILNADKFAVQCGYGSSLRKAILKTSIDDLNIAEFNAVYTFYFMDRPPLNKRLSLIEEEINRRQ